MQSTLERVSSLLAGDLNYDRVAEAKRIVNEFLDSREKPKTLTKKPKNWRVRISR